MARSDRKSFGARIRFVAIGLASCLIAYLVASGSPPQTVEDASVVPARSYSHEGLTLFVPAGALERDVDIQISRLERKELAALDQGMTNVTTSRGGYRLDPHGLTFREPVTLSLPYDPAFLIPLGQSPDDIYTYFYDELADSWKRLERVQVDPARQVVVSTTTHFTDFINGTVTVPDHPNPLSLNPTSMKDIKAADPGAGINLIEPPRPNNFGTANLRYPIEVPPGRNGMQPDVALQYDSSAANGWMGLGWDIPMQAITIDTRWGVPRYDDDDDGAGGPDLALETETYVLNGEQLTPVAHRGELQARTAEKEFHTRVEGLFRKIIRHGDHPTNYWWEVIDKDGTRSFYGGDPVLNAQAAESTLTDPVPGSTQNIFKWALREVRDTNDNTIRYKCVRVIDPGLPDGTVDGVQLYLDEIRYTGFGSDDGLYSVRFIREQGRPDVMIDCRSGFKMVTADRLARIDIALGQPSPKYQQVNVSTGLIRSYEFEYEIGAFEKSLLKSITQLGENGEFFNEHEFDYFDEVRGSGTYAGFSLDDSAWSVIDDGVEAGFYGGEASALGGFLSSSISGHLYVGFSTCWAGKQFSFGGKGGFNVSETEEVVSLTDLDGDALPDKVFRAVDGNLYYRRNLSGPDGNFAFSSIALPIPTLPSLSQENADSFNGGAEAYVVVASVFINAADTTTASPIYFSDVNADGLTDLADNGSVWFNHLHPTSGVPTFTLSSLDTPVPVDSGTVQVADLIEDYRALLAERLANNPLLDPVRRWQAPFDGQVAITAPVQLVEDNSKRAANYPFADGVRVAIQHNGTELWSTMIDPDDYSVHTPVGLGAINVAKDDRIYFRVQSVHDGAFDQVNWAPVIEYVGAPADATDVNLLNPYRYAAIDDFVQAGRGGQVGVPFTGMMRVVGTAEKTGQTTDDVTLMVRKHGLPGDPPEIVLSHTFAWNAVGTMPLQADFSVVAAGACVDATGDPCPAGGACLCQGGLNDGAQCDGGLCPGNTLEFFIEVDSPIDLSHIEWNPELFYTQADGIDPLIDPNTGEYLFRIKPPVDIDLYPETELNGVQPAWTVPPHTGEIVIIADLAVQPFPHPPVNGHLTLTVKRRGEPIAKGAISIQNSILGGDLSFPIDVATGDELFFDYSTRHGRAESCANPDPGLASKLPLKNVKALYDPPGLPDPVQVNVPSAFRSAIVLDNTLFNESYRGWAFVAYQGGGATEAPIDESKLILDYCALADAAEQAKQNGTYSFYEESTLPLAPISRDSDIWGGQDEHVWVAADRMSSSRRGADHIEVPEPGNIAAGRSVERISVGDQDAVGIGVGFLSGSRACGSSSAKLDFMDMNGDAFPDVIGIDKIQYTTMTGGLEENPVPVAQFNGIRDSTNESQNAGAGFGVGGNPATTKANSRNGVAPTGSKSNSTGEQGSQMPSLGFSGQLGCGLSRSNFDLMDINGDGLPDKVRNEQLSCSDIELLDICPDPGGPSQLYAALNLGYGFADEELWGNAVVNDGRSSSFDLGTKLGIAAAFNDGIYGFGGGVSISKSDSWTDRTLADVNGDGLPDAVRSAGNQMHVALNTGAGFAPEALWSDVAHQHTGASSSTGQGLGAYFTISIGPLCWPTPCCWIIINPGINAGIDSMARPELVLRDVNGDAYPDHLRSDDEGTLDVALNQTGRTNLLQPVIRPLGATITLDYSRDGNTYDLPQSRWNLSRVEVFDGFCGDGVDTLLSTYVYEAGRYNRNEREFYGYGTVTEEHRDSSNGDALYRTIARTYHNDTYYNKRLLESEVLHDAAGHKFTEEVNTYLLLDVATNAELAAPDSTIATVFPQLIRTDHYFYEGQPGAGKSTYTTHAYDAFGNVVEMVDAGDVGAGDDVTSSIEYFDDAANYIVGIPNKIVVTGNGVELRHREADIEAGSGDLRQVRQYLETGEVAATDLDYFPNGNLQRVTGPPNLHGDHYMVEFLYDDVVTTHITLIRDSFGYESTATYNLHFGKEDVTTDINGNQTDYAYDVFGRVSAITGPYETGGPIPTLRFEYHPDAAAVVCPGQPGVMPWALTRHIDTFRDINDSIDTVLFTDGLKRVLQTKKDGTLHTGADSAAQDMIIVSGRVTFDLVGRSIQQFYPTTETLGTPGVFNPGQDTVIPTVTEYDVLDRITRITIPDGTTTTSAYGFGSDRNGALQFETIVTDANGIEKRTYRNVRELITSIREVNNGGAEVLWTSYEYDPLKQLVGAADDHSNVTQIAYDNFGRTTAIDNPDTGLVASHYDLAGNLTAKITPNLRAANAEIAYDYEFNRIVAISYPLLPDNNVAYSYGDPGAPFNRAARIVLVTDESGSEERFYGNLGELVKEIKTVASDTDGPEVHTTEYTYDTWNRLEQMVYPDSEVLTYSYDSGGLVRSAEGLKNGIAFPYLERLEYDKFEQRVLMQTQNGVRTTYAYDPLDRRLATLTAANVGESPFQNLHYAYDDVGNVLQTHNDVSVPPPSDFGGPVLQSYAYDDLYRLVSASGTHQFAPNKTSVYGLTMTYDSIHNITYKDQTHELIQPSGQGVEQHDTTYTWSYAYDGLQPHAPTHIGERTFSYDANGNQTGWEHDQNGTDRTIVWDEENRIQSIADNGHTKTYKYDDSGERVIKRGPQGETAYVNPYFTVRNGTIATKHIYADMSRVASKLSPGFSNPQPPNGVPESNFLYFYHPDHLGSSSYVTDADGELYEHLQYFPFGETWVQEKSNTQQAPYLFTAKELDEETGLYYHGARYYDPRTSVWQSADPALEMTVVSQHPHKLALYSYVGNNPLQYTDPTGLDWRSWLDRQANRVVGGFKILGAVAIASVSVAATIGTEGSLGPLGWAGVLYASDLGASGLHDLWTGEPSRTLSNQALKAGVQAAGADPQTAEQFADWAEFTAQIAIPIAAAVRTPPQRPSPLVKITPATVGLRGRVLSAAEQAEFTKFGARARRLGLGENPHRTGSWGQSIKGKFQEVTRIDVAEPGKPGWRGKTHVHIEGKPGHLDPNTKLPGE